MKYRHSFHAGNFADVHKHVTLLALVDALTKKDKGFLYLDTHAGRGSYDLSTPSPEAAAGIGRFAQRTPAAAELRRYAQVLAELRARLGQRHMYPGSPLIALSQLRAQDRAVFAELQGAEAHALEQASREAAPAHGARSVTVERVDGLARLKGCLPPPERRALVFIDPPYEQQQELARVSAALADGLRRFPTGVFAAWYPVKDARDVTAWQEQWAHSCSAPTLVSELWLYRRDSRVALNGSGMLLVNPPWLILERMQVWLPELTAALAVGPAAGSEARMLAQSSQ
jgi:23S rRNA (adenine2030-N6)-methyltransferase